MATTIITISLALVAIILIISFLTYKFTFYNSRRKPANIHYIPKSEQYKSQKQRMHQLIDDLAKLPFERVQIKSKDGKTLVAKYYHNSNNAPLAICFHGYRGSSIRDFCGGANILFSLNQNVLLVDQRAQGESQGHTMTFGIKEQFDALDWINYSINRFGKDTKIYLYGVSMGAATVLLTSGLELAPNVKAVIADSPYSSPSQIIKKVCKTDLHLPIFLAYPFLVLGGLIFGGININKFSCMTAVQNAKIPILIIHGDADKFVPHQMSINIKSASPKNIRLEIFKDAGHGLSYIVDTPRYEKIVKEFFNKTNK